MEKEITDAVRKEKFFGIVSQGQFVRLSFLVFESLRFNSLSRWREMTIVGSQRCIKSNVLLVLHYAVCKILKAS